MLPNARQAATVPNLRLEIEESCFKNQSNPGDKMRPESTKMSQDSAQERQDEAR